jgi:oligopeptide/dipeptide ABC transporter ATP-binding protein
VTPILEVEGLRVQLQGRRGRVTVVDGADFTLREGEILGVAGESGSGKTLSMLSLLGLLPAGAVVEGRAMFGGQDLLALQGRALRDVRGAQIGMVFQDPMTSLHPMVTIGRALTEHLRFHTKMKKAEARRRAIELLEEVRMPDPEGCLRAYPHQFSGGMRQRLAIAVALVCKPKILIADEPTTALDVTVQAGIVRLLDRLRRETGLSVLMITHDLGVLSAIADRISVMYAGRVIETGVKRDILRAPRHPYTAGLLDALPHPEAPADTPLLTIAGAPPSANDVISGCKFHPRCRFAQDSCRTEVPSFVTAADGREFACPVDPLPATRAEVVR